MSDLAATNCGCECNSGGCGTGSCGSLIWILLILSCCGGNGFNLGCEHNGSCGCGGFNNNSDWIWLILILSCCGGGCGRSFC